MSFIFGTIITILGVLFLGTNLGWWNGIAWQNLWLLWPLIIILIGLRLLVKSAVLFLIGALIILGLAVALVAVSESQPSLTRPWMMHPSAEQANFTNTLPVGDTTTFEAELGGVYDLEIQGGTGTTVTTNLTGPKDLIERLRLDTSGTTIRLRDNQSSGPWRIWNWHDYKVSGTITLPATHALTLDLSGLTDVAVRNHTGKATVTISGASSTDFSSSTTSDPDIELSGAGKVTLDSCQGNGALEISGAGQIVARTCTLNQLRIDASGAAKVEIQQGTIENATIDASGATNVTIPKPTGTIQQDTSGASKINLK